MEELKQLLLRLIAVILIGLFGIWLSNNNPFILFSSLYCPEVQLTINFNNGTLFFEKYTYKVNESHRYRMLYRFWKIPLLFPSTPPKFPSVKLASIQAPTDYYAKDYRGNITGKFKNPLSVSLVKSLAQKNEIGIVNPDYFNKGEYTLSASYSLFPPVQTDGKTYHLNFKIADYHVPYKEVTLKILDPKRIIEKVYPHFTVSSIEKRQGEIEIKGTSSANELLEVEFLLKENPNSPFLVKENLNVKEKTERLNRFLYPSFLISSLLQKLLTLSILSLPALTLLLYLKMGTEKYFAVPKYLSFIPKKRKPYIVNLIFCGDASEGDENGFYATLLDLHERGAIKLLEGGRVEIANPNLAEDPFEKKVLNLLIKYSEKRENKTVFSPQKLKDTAERLKLAREVSFLERMKAEWEQVLNFKDPFITEKFLETKLPNLVNALTGTTFLITFFTFFFSLFLHKELPFINYYKINVLTASLFLQFAVLSTMPAQVLGRWKRNYYQEKLKWEAFKNFLTNFAMIRKYSKEDLSIWKEWLVYATALGVADKVAEALKEMKINLPEVENLKTFQVYFTSSYLFLSDAVSDLKSESSSGGGGFGSGGGFGGGGAGGR